MQSAAAASSMLTQASAPVSRICQASGETSPHASPPMMLSSTPSAGVGRPARTLRRMQSAACGSTTMRRRALRATTLPEIRARRRRQAADPALHEDVGGDAGTLREGLVGDQAVTLHHVARCLEAAVRGRIGDHVPALRRRVQRSLAHGVVERAGEAAHLRAISLDRAGAARADHVRHVDDAGAAEAAGAPGHRAAVIAVGRAGDGHAGSKIGAAAGGEIARGDGDLLRREDVPLPAP